MKVSFELLTLLREKAGTDHLELEVPGETPFGTAACKSGGSSTVLSALQALQGALAGRGVLLLEGERVPGGMLVFLKSPTGGMTRVLQPAEARIAEGERVVLSAAMAGG
jgi:molybdopterin converting factor small subunit